MAIEISPVATGAMLSSILSTSTAAAVVTIATAVANAAANSPNDPSSFTSGHDKPPPPPPNGECSLLGPFALVVQGALGILALSALVFKRWRERPQRPLKIWAFDVSKQVVGSILVHVANLLMSMLSSGQFVVKVTPGTVSSVPLGGGFEDEGVAMKVARALVGRGDDERGQYQPNPCSFYLLNLAIDTTIGIPILIILLRVFTGLFALTPLGRPKESIKSGHYGSPPRYTWWVKQSLIYFLGLLGMKICVLVIFLMLPWLGKVGDWALRWTEGNEELQVFFVMCFFPLIMNATQYYIIDTFIKNKDGHDDGGTHEPLTQSDEERFERVARAGDDADDEDFSGMESDTSEVEAEVVAKKHLHVSSKNVKGLEVRHKKGKSSRPLGADRHVYDEAYDGESSPTIVGSEGSRKRDTRNDDAAAGASGGGKLGSLKREDRPLE